MFKQCTKHCLVTAGLKVAAITAMVRVVARLTYPGEITNFVLAYAYELIINIAAIVNNALIFVVHYRYGNGVMLNRYSHYPLY